MTRLTLDEIKASQPAEFRAAMDKLVRDQYADKCKGGPWRLFMPLPGRTKATHFVASFASEELAKAHIKPWYPHIRNNCVILYR